MKRLPISAILLFLMVAEIVSIALVADWLGGLWTVLLMAASFGVGVLMLRNLGFSSVFLAGSLLQQRDGMSLYQLLWPIRYIVAALLLLSPGFVSTLLAAGLMLPLKGGRQFHAFHQPFTPQDDNVIDGQFSTVRPSSTPNAPPSKYLENQETNQQDK